MYQRIQNRTDHAIATLRKIKKEVLTDEMKSEQLGIDGKERDEELLQAASWIDGYMKQHRRELLDVEQLAFYVAIRELVNLLGSEFKELNKEQIKVLISTEEDWKRYQSIPEAVGQIEDQ